MNIRTIALLILFWIGWVLIRKQLELHRQKTRSTPTTRKDNSTLMVKCEYCQVHLPANEALEQNGEWFCNRKHRQAWLEKS